MELFVFSDYSGKMICATAYIRLTFVYENKISRHAALAIAKIHTKSEGISLPTAELLSIKTERMLRRLHKDYLELRRKIHIFTMTL